jgi:lipid-binding SYLF domain-containing protein
MLLAAGSLVTGCAHTPRNAEERSSLVDDAQHALDKMVSADPNLRNTLDQSAGYVIFPHVWQAGFIAGGGAGKGVVFERGRVVGFATLEQGSVGATIGGQTYRELIIARDPYALTQLKNGDFHWDRQLSATAVKSGVASEHLFHNGIAVFVQPESGGMVNASIGGQRIRISM